MLAAAILAFAAISASASPTARSTSTAPETLSVSISSGEDCNILGGGYPPELEDGVCYNTTGPINSLEIYMQPFEGASLTVYADGGCCGETSGFSTFYVGCQKSSIAGHGIKYTRS